MTPGYLEALRIPLLRGRAFTSADSERAALAVIISAELARDYFPGSDPIGQRIWFNSFDDPNQPRWLTIVGIADDVRQGGLTARLRPQAYVPYTQVTRTGQLSEGTLVVRTPLDPASLAVAVRSRIQSVDRGAAVTFRTMDAVMRDAVARQRFQMQVLAAFALLALLLAAIGLYGVLSYAVSSERVEIGIRMALGAQPGEVFLMVTGRALLMASMGGVLGLGRLPGGAWTAGRASVRGGRRRPGDLGCGCRAAAGGGLRRQFASRAARHAPGPGDRPARRVEAPDARAMIVGLCLHRCTWKNTSPHRPQSATWSSECPMA